MQESLEGFLSSPLGFGIFFVSLWCLVCFLIGFAGGWYSLARRFRAQGEPYGDVRSVGPFFYGVQMRLGTSYSSVIRLTAGRDALYLSVLLLFRVGHPPLAVPWSEIKLRRAKFLWRRYILLTLGNEERLPMRISERMALRLGILERVGREDTV